MFKITHNNKCYSVDKDKLVYILERLTNKKVEEKEIRKLLKKYHLYDEYFLEHVNKIYD